jgi:hypothetical protein
MVWTLRLEDICTHERLRRVICAVSFKQGLDLYRTTMYAKVGIIVVLDKNGLTGRKMRPTEVNVPGRKNRVTSVMTFIETVSIFVWRAMSFISSVIVQMLFVEYLFAWVFWYSRTFCN